VARLPPIAPAIAPIIRAFGTGIAEAQRSLDYASLRIARVMGGLDPGAFALPGEQPRPEGLPAPALTTPSGRSYNLLELGFSPTFYRFTDAVLDLRLAMSTSEESARTDPLKPKVKVGVGIGLSGVSVRVQTVTGSYSCRYQYASEASSRMRTRVASVPAPSLLTARLAAMAAARGRGADA
jgi:hypothetical protein